jgi:hypothetical protein
MAQQSDQEAQTQRPVNPTLFMILQMQIVDLPPNSIYIKGVPRVRVIRYPEKPVGHNHTFQIFNTKVWEWQDEAHGTARRCMSRLAGFRLMGQAELDQE